MADMELLAQVWVGDDDTGGLERCVIEVERTDLDEVRVGIIEGDQGERDETTHVYIERDRALKLGHALIEAALERWQVDELERARRFFVRCQHVRAGRSA